MKWKNRSIRRLGVGGVEKMEGENSRCSKWPEKNVSLGAYLVGRKGLRKDSLC